MLALDAAYSSGKLQQIATVLDLAAQIFCQPNYRREAEVLRNAAFLSGMSTFGNARTTTADVSNRSYTVPS